MHLRVYKGKKILWNENREIDNENQRVSLIYNNFEWLNYLKQIKGGGFCKVEVERFFENENGKQKDIDKSDIVKIIDEAFKGVEEKKELTPEQKEIAELKAQMAELLGKKKETKKVVSDDNPDELKKVKADYKKKFNKIAYHGWSLEQIKEKLK